MTKCSQCNGIGRVGSISSQSVQIIRAIEQDLIKNGKNNIILSTSNELSNYLLNAKRRNLYEIEDRYGIVIEIKIADFDGDETFNIERIELKTDDKSNNSAISIDSVYEDNSDVESSTDDDVTPSKIAKSETKSRKPARRKSQIKQKGAKKISVADTKEEKQDHEKEVKEVDKSTLKNQQKKEKAPKVQKKVDAKVAKEHNKTSTPKKDLVKKKRSVTKKIETERPLENPKTGWWDD